jgi:RNA recognition motif-containing protein
MGTKNQCLKAIKRLNGSSFKGRTIVLDMAVSKENYMTEKLNESQKAEQNRPVKAEEREPQPEPEMQNESDHQQKKQHPRNKIKN